jgi:hypothetical protein
MQTMQDFIRERIPQFGSAKAFAAAIGMSLSAFNKGVRKHGRLSIENCLKVAELTCQPPSTVLRMAGKEDLAAAWERLCGKSEMCETERLIQSFVPEYEKAVRTMLEIGRQGAVRDRLDGQEPPSKDVRGERTARRNVPRSSRVPVEAPGGPGRPVRRVRATPKGGAPAIPEI